MLLLMYCLMFCKCFEYMKVLQYLLTVLLLILNKNDTKIVVVIPCPKNTLKICKNLVVLIDKVE